MADNMNPHAEAILAVNLWPEEYAGQRGGCMDFWENLSASRQRRTVEIVDRITWAIRDTGRAEKGGDR